MHTNRLDLAGQSQFWCGFCNHTVPLLNHGPAACDERFNHIDVEHFRKGEKGQDWSLPSALEEVSGLLLDSGNEMDTTVDAVVESSAPRSSGGAPGVNRRKRKCMAS